MEWPETVEIAPNRLEGVQKAANMQLAQSHQQAIAIDAVKKEATQENIRCDKENNQLRQQVHQLTDGFGLDVSVRLRQEREKLVGTQLDNECHNCF